MKRGTMKWAFGLTLTLSVLAFGQGAPGDSPRTREGHVNLNTIPGQPGLWMPVNAGDERLVELDSTLPEASNQFTIDANPLMRLPRLEGISSSDAAKLAGKLTVGQIPFQPWARALYAHRAENPLEPHTRCKPSGGSRQFMTPYGVEFVDAPELHRLFIVDIGGPHTVRIVYMDGREHPKDPDPSYLGHSTGRWENDTLVIDSVGFNERFWFDRTGLPHTDKLHLVERITRTDVNTIKYQVTVDDPGAYTAKFSTGIILRWAAGPELFEYVCQDNNHAPELTIGLEKSTNVRPVIVP